MTIVYQGELAHRDSTGAGGLIGPGDVQWMTAASGILHEEFHSPAFARAGGTLEMVQLWVNLPRRHKSVAPSYQTLTAAAIPVASLPDGAGSVRIIAGRFDTHRGPARTYSELDVWDVRLNAGKSMQLPVMEGRKAALIVLRGTTLVEDSVVREGQWALLGAEGAGTRVEANSDSTILLLSGAPLDEPIVGHGPFVMNTEEEILEAYRDFQSGAFGQPATTA